MRGFILVLLTICLSLSIIGCGMPTTKQDRDISYRITKQAYDKYWGKNWPMVIKMTTEAIKYDDEFPWPYSLRGAAYSAMGKYKEALKDLDKTIKLSPDFSPAFTNRGLTYMRMKDYEKAEADFAEALVLDPTDIPVLLNMAELMARKGDVEKSCKYILDAVNSGFRKLTTIEEDRVFEKIIFEECYDEILKQAH